MEHTAVNAPRSYYLSNNYELKFQTLFFSKTKQNRRGKESRIRKKDSLPDQELQAHRMG